VYVSAVTESDRWPTIVFELPPSAQGTYQYEREDGATVRGDASGEWTLDEHGEVSDIIFFGSPRRPD
jgi:hypothetical protein